MIESADVTIRDSVRWDLLQRYRLIEIVALWEGRLTTNTLMQAFGISRQQASKDINTYNNIFNPNALTYDKTLKGYKPSTIFQPIFTQGNTDEYLQLVSSQFESGTGIVSLSANTLHTTILKVPESHTINPAMIYGIVVAVRQKKRLKINYVSLRTPIPSSRIISPHTLIYSGFRWYVRAYCEKRQNFIDFALSRLRDKPELLEETSFDISKDTLWNKKVTIKITPDPRLPKEKQAIIECDYGMENKMLCINTNAALVDYVLKLMRIDPAVHSNTPEAQQIIVQNLEEIQQYLFH